MNTDNIERYLNSFGKYIVQQSRTNLTKGTKKYGTKNVTKALYNSLRFDIESDSDGFTVNFYMLDYGTFVDKGVSGKNKIRTYKNYEGKQLDSPYRYTNRMPPPNLLDKWIVRRGLAPRTKEGRFKKRTIGEAGFAKSIQFLVARKIFFNGIQGISFFQRPLELAFKKFGPELLSMIAKDVTNSIKDSTKDLK